MHDWRLCHSQIEDIYQPRAAVYSSPSQGRRANLVLPSSTYLLTVGVEGFDFSLDHTQTHTTLVRTPLD
jgi:hypothetical protein